MLRRSVLVLDQIVRLKEQDGMMLGERLSHLEESLFLL
jgi:hypothetical protein